MNLALSSSIPPSFRVVFPPHQSKMSPLLIKDLYARSILIPYNYLPKPMPLFQTAIKIDHTHIAQIVTKHWNIKLGKLLKASQNHTFDAMSHDGLNKYSVRVTPDPQKKHLQRINDELTFVNYLVKAELQHLVRPIPSIWESEHGVFVVVGDLIVVVFEWAKGQPLNFMEFRWMRDKAVIFAWGRFFAKLHKLSQTFETEHSQTAQRVQKWDSIHNSILAGIKLHPDDIAVLNNPEHYGVIHGDLNCSNIHYVDDGDYLSVYDTDQVQRGFYMFDLAQAIVALPMLEVGGVPVVGTPVQGINTPEFIATMVAGYESQGLKVDMPRLQRMVDIKKQLYVRFAVQGLKEGNAPQQMLAFLKFIDKVLVPKWKIEE